MDAVAKHGDRSRFIDAAVDEYIREHSRRRLQADLKEGAVLRAERDRDLAAVMFAIDDTWERTQK
jgi:CopG family transcriptional regulator/antitoxin EndoAI